MKHSIQFIFAFCAMLAMLWQPLHSNAQTSYSYGTSASETFRSSAVNPTDNSFLVGGFEDASIDPGILINLDGTGAINWAKKYAHTQSMDLKDIHMKDDGKAVLLFYTINTALNVNRRDALLMEIDGSGTVLWAKTYVNTAREVRLHKITALSSGDYILTGSASNNISTSYSNYLHTIMKVDAGGNQLWVRRDVDSNNGNLSINEATESADGNLLVAGHMWHAINSSGSFHNGYVAKIDVSDGSIIWNKEYPSSIEVNFHQIEELASGDIVITGALAESNTAGFITRKQLFVQISSTGTVNIAKAFDFPGGNQATTFKRDAATGNFLFAGIEAASNSTTDRNNYWIELTENGDIVEGYRYILPDFEGNPILEINDVSINMFTTTKSFPADPAATANNDFAMFLIDRSNPSEDCNATQIEAVGTDFSFGTLESVSLELDGDFTLTETAIELAVEETPFLQANICFEEEPLVIEGITTDEYCALSTGTVDIAVSGGTTPYAYNWSNGAISEDLNGLVGGAYIVTVTDASGTTATGMFIVQANDMLVTASQVDCDGMGTSDTSDDLIYIDVNALYNYTVGPTSDMYNVYDDASNTLLGTFSYPIDGTITVTYTPFITLRFEDFDNPECFKLFTLDLQSCSPACDPSWVCPTDICVSTDGEGCGAVVDYDLQLDDCNGTAILTLLEGMPSGSAFPLGTTTVTYELDTGSELLLCSFEVTVGNTTPLISDYALRGNAALIAGQDNCIMLTPNSTYKRGSMWYQRKLDLSYDFKLNFDIYLGTNNSGADGMMFIMQPLSTDLGGSGGSLGFSGIAPSVGIEFDTWQNTEPQYANEPTGDHIAIQANGSLAHDATGYLDAGATLQTVPNMENGAYHNVNITWDATNHELTYVYDGTTTQTVTQDIVSTIFGNDPYVYWGWAAGTGIATNEHRVCVNNIAFVDAITADETITDVYCGVVGKVDLAVSGGIAPYTYMWSDGSTNQSLDNITMGGDYTVTITDACGNTLEATYTVGQEECPCTITGSLFQEGCDNMGNCDPSDDIIYLYFTVTATNGGPSGMFSMIDANTNAILGTFPYGTNVIAIPYSPFISVIFEDVDNPECVAEAAIDLQPCDPGMPTLACPDDIFTVLDGTGCDVIVDYAIDYDDCGGTYVLTQTAGLASGSAFPLGTTVVTYELSDGVNTITCSFNVNVSNVAPTAGDFVTVQNASLLQGTCFEVTPDLNNQAGAVWYQKKLNLDYDFELNFEINLGSTGTGADGMMFILQPLSTAIGGNGGNLGFSGVSPSVGIEFDTYYNGQFSDPSNDHISFQKNGNLNHVAAGYLDSSVPRNIVANIEDGNFHDVVMTWNATTKELTYDFDNGLETGTVTQDIVNTIFGGDPNVFWGWTAATASRKNRHQVCVNDLSFTESITIDAIVTDIPCGGEGMIDLTVSGGVAPYTFAWSDGSINEDLLSITTVGDYAVTVTDACGNTIEQTYTITEEECPCTITGTLFQEGCDNMGTCDPSDDIVFIYVDATAMNGGPSGMFNVTDASTNALLGTFPYNGGGMFTIPAGAAFITVIFTDADNADCVTELAIDLQPCDSDILPTLTCPDDIFAVLDGTGCEVVVDYALDYDDCGGTYTLTQTAGLASGSAFPLGTTVVTYELSDGVNTITCSFNVNVSNVVPTAGDFITVQDASLTEGTCFEVTPDLYNKAGAVWYQKKMNLDYDFELNFDINLGSRGAGGADGMMFILQPLNTAIGGNGGNLGFSGVSPSIGVEFDTYYNGQFADPTNDHISFQKNGSLAHNAAGYLDASVPRNTTVNIEDGNFHPVTIKWNATTKELTYIFDGNETATVTQDIVNTIFGGDPNVFWGWSAGTASKRNRHQVCVKDLSFTEAITVDAVITDVPCDGAGGMIDLTVSGGVAPYTFLWSDGSINEDLVPVAIGGDYTVTVTDACGNTVEHTYTVGEEECCSIVAELFQEGCDGMNTVDVNDDLIYIYVNATNGTSTGMFNVYNGATLLGTFPYGGGSVITVPYAPFISLTYVDANNEECLTELAIDLQPCSPTCTDVNISITLDNYPKETSWDLKDGQGNIIASSNGHLGQNPDGTVITFDTCLVDDCYDFTIYDSYGDGICCDPFYGNGSYTVTDMSTNTVLGAGGQFGFSETTNFCLGDATPVTCTYEPVKNNTFEGGWGVWNDGGDNCERIQSTGIGTAGNWSIRLRNGTSSSNMTTNNLNMSTYTEATVELMYQCRSMDDSTEGFELEMSTDGGATFTFVEEWNRDDEFVNTVNYTDAVVIPGPFTATTQFRFKCIANGNFDHVYFDKVVITGCAEQERPENVRPTKKEDVINKPDLAIANLYPNPASDNVNIEYAARIDGKVDIAVYNTTGQLVLSVVSYAKEGENLFTLDLDRLNGGTYMVEINDGKKRDIKRLVIIK